MKPVHVFSLSARKFVLMNTTLTEAFLGSAGEQLQNTKSPRPQPKCWHGFGKTRQMGLHKQSAVAKIIHPRPEPSAIT